MSKINSSFLREKEVTLSNYNEILVEGLGNFSTTQLLTRVTSEYSPCEPSGRRTHEGFFSIVVLNLPQIQGFSNLLKTLNARIKTSQSDSLVCPLVMISSC